MRFKLTEILKSTIILEGRKEDAIKKYGEEWSDLIENLSENDPSGNNKYLDWMVNQVINVSGSVDPVIESERVINLVRDFHRLLPRISKKDINSYKTFNELLSVVDDAKKSEQESKATKEAKKIYDKDGVVIYVPLTVQASCKYGRGSKWCISGTSDSRNLNTYFDDYSKHSNFYFLINNNIDDKREFKYALQWRFDGGGRELTWWDAVDDPHNERPDWVTDEMWSAIEAFNPKHKMIKLKTQMLSFIETPNFEDYPKFSDMLNKEQKIKVIDDIINKGNLTSKAFSILLKDLTEKQKSKFITTYVKGEVTASDYKIMEENLNKKEKILLFKNNEHLLNNYDIISKLDSELNDKEKFDITQNIDQSKINFTDSKILLKKWSMTEEDREKYNKTSYYVFLSSDDLYIEKLVKVGPLNPESYRTINMMKLRKQSSGVSMYGIKTDGNLLDEYIGNSSDDMDGKTIEFIRKNVNQL